MKKEWCTEVFQQKQQQKCSQICPICTRHWKNRNTARVAIWRLGPGSFCSWGWSVGRPMAAGTAIHATGRAGVHLVGPAGGHRGGPQVTRLAGPGVLWSPVAANRVVCAQHAHTDSGGPAATGQVRSEMGAGEIRAAARAPGHRARFRPTSCRRHFSSTNDVVAQAQSGMSLVRKDPIEVRSGCRHDLHTRAHRTTPALAPCSRGSHATCLMCPAAGREVCVEPPRVEHDPSCAPTPGDH